MSKTYKMIRLVGTSPESYEKAIQNALHDAKESLKGLNWFQVVEYRGHIGEDGSVNEWQVVIDVAFKILRA